MSDVTIILDDQGKEHTYTLTRFAFPVALTLWAQVQKVAGSNIMDEALAPMAKEILGDPTDEQSTFTKGFRQLARGVCMSGEVRLVEQLLREAARDDVGLQGEGLSRAFQGNTGESIRAVEYVLKENFAGFLAESSAAAEAWGTHLGKTGNQLFQKLQSLFSNGLGRIGASTKSGLDSQKQG